MSPSEEYLLDPINADDDYNMIVLIQQTGHAAYLARGRELKKYDISNMWAATLLVVAASDNTATPTQISRWLLREPHSISGLLDRMEREGYVHRYTDRRRRNVVRVAMTDRGRKAYEDSLRREPFHTIMKAISSEERELLRAIMIKLWKAALTEVGSDGDWASRAASHIQNGGLPGAVIQEEMQEEAAQMAEKTPRSRPRGRTRTATQRGLLRDDKA